MVILAVLLPYYYAQMEWMSWLQSLEGEKNITNQITPTCVFHKKDIYVFLQPLRGAEESDTLRERPVAGDLRCVWLGGVESLNTLDGGCCADWLSHVLQ